MNSVQTRYKRIHVFIEQLLGMKVLPKTISLMFPAIPFGLMDWDQSLIVVPGLEPVASDVQFPVSPVARGYLLFSGNSSDEPRDFHCDIRPVTWIRCHNSSIVNFSAHLVHRRE